MKKVLVLMIVAVLLVNVIVMPASAIVFSGGPVALYYHPNDWMYYELGVGQNRVRAETGVNTANTYAVLLYFSVWVDNNNVQDLIYNDYSESDTTRYVELIYNHDNIMNIIYRTRSTHKVMSNIGYEAWETLDKQKTSTGWSNYSG